MKWAGHAARMGEGRGVHRVLMGKPEGKRPLGRPRRRWEDNIKMDLQEAGGGCKAWMELAQDRDRWRALVGTVITLKEAIKAQRYSSSLSSTSVLVGSRRSTPRPGRFIPVKETRFPFYRRMGGPQRRCGYVRKISQNKD